jgi:hypothetical protein
MQTVQALFATAVVVLLSGCAESINEAQEREHAEPLPPPTVELATQKGKQIVGDAFTLLSSNLQNAIQQGGISNALPYCSVAAQPLTESAGKARGVTVRRITHKPRNPRGKATEAELAVLDQFRASMAGTNAPAPLVTNFSPDEVTFFAPIVLTQELCLKCHGEAGKDISPEHVALIDKLYPGDQAKGFKTGDLRGAWRVDFPLAALRSSE